MTQPIGPGLRGSIITYAELREYNKMLSTKTEWERAKIRATVRLAQVQRKRERQMVRT